MQKGNYLCMTMRQDMPREALESRRSRAACVDQRCHPRIDAADIGINAEARESFEDVGMQIDEARRDDGTGNIDDASRFFTRNRRRDPRNLASLDRYIERPI